MLSRGVLLQLHVWKRLLVAVITVNVCIYCHSQYKFRIRYIQSSSTTHFGLCWPHHVDIRATYMDKYPEMEVSLSHLTH
jgi:hypothetical protein